MRLFSSIPFFRILIPFVVGILLGFAGLTLPLWYPVPAAAALAAGMLRNAKEYRLRNMLLGDLFLLVLGISMCQLTGKHPATEDDAAWHNEKKIYLMQLTEVPVKKTRYLKCEAQVLGVADGRSFKTLRRKALLYVRNSGRNQDLLPGAVLQIKTRFGSLPAPMNPAAFDYGHYLAAHHVTGIAFADSADIVNIEQDQARTLPQLGLAVKFAIIEKLRGSGLSQTAFAICCALLTGYDDEIEKGTMNAFAHSGTLHVLSVSGLHTGLIYGMLSFLIGLVDRRRKHRTAEFITVTAVLWLFALMTGFSPPVLRAVIMFNLMGFGKIFFRQNYRNQMNILLVSAFILLLYDPWLLQDAGFLLSYFAMFGLFYFQPAISALWQPANPILKAAWSACAASAAATISTLPITLYLFRQFPLWFALANLLVVPCSFVLLVLAMAVIVKIPLSVWLANKLTWLLQGFIALFNQGSFAYFDNIDFRKTDILFLSLLIISVSIALQIRSRSWFFTGLVLLICWQAGSLWQSYRSKTLNQFTDYSVRQAHLSSVKIGSHVLVQCSDSNALEYTLRPHLATMNYPRVYPARYNFIRSDHNCILFVDSLVPVLKDSGHIQIMVIRKGFRGAWPALGNMPALRTIVLEQGLPENAIVKAQEFSRTFGYRLCSLRDEGAFISNLD